MSYLNASLTLIFGGFRAPFEIWWRDRLFYAKIFKRVLDITLIKMCHLKGEKRNGKALEDSKQMDLTLKG